MRTLKVIGVFAAATVLGVYIPVAVVNAIVLILK